MKNIIYSIEDDLNISKIINKALSNQGYIIESFYDGKSFFKRLEEAIPNMILLDLMLPDMEGMEILKRIRDKKEYDDVEIIIISAKHMLMDKVDGLDLGADDYIEKPFDLLELISRVNAKFRRFKSKNILQHNGIIFDKEKHNVTYNNVKISLTVKEFDILELLMKNAGDVVSREDILNIIWDDKDAYETRTIDMHIRSIRKKFNEDIISTIYGVGYKLN